MNTKYDRDTPRVRRRPQPGKPSYEDVFLNVLVEIRNVLIEIRGRVHDAERAAEQARQREDALLDRIQTLALAAGQKVELPLEEKPWLSSGDHEETEWQEHLGVVEEAE